MFGLLVLSLNKVVQYIITSCLGCLCCVSTKWSSTSSLHVWVACVVSQQSGVVHHHFMFGLLVLCLNKVVQYIITSCLGCLCCLSTKWSSTSSLHVWVACVVSQQSGLVHHHFMFGLLVLCLNKVIQYIITSCLGCLCCLSTKWSSTSSLHVWVACVVSQQSGLVHHHFMFGLLVLSLNKVVQYIITSCLGCLCCVSTKWSSTSSLHVWVACVVSQQSGLVHHHFMFGLLVLCLNKVVQYIITSCLGCLCCVSTKWSSTSSLHVWVACVVSQQSGLVHHHFMFGLLVLCLNKVVQYIITSCLGCLCCLSTK